MVLLQHACLTLFPTDVGKVTAAGRADRACRSAEQLAEQGQQVSPYGDASPLTGQQLYLRSTLGAALTAQWTAGVRLVVAISIPTCLPVGAAEVASCAAARLVCMEVRSRKAESESWPPVG